MAYLGDGGFAALPYQRRDLRVRGGRSVAVGQELLGPYAPGGIHRAVFDVYKRDAGGGDLSVDLKRPFRGEPESVTRGGGRRVRGGLRVKR